jgi:hypothetical protein
MGEGIRQCSCKTAKKLACRHVAGRKLQRTLAHAWPHAINPMTVVCALSNP